jgi:hypothetical protein
MESSVKLKRFLGLSAVVFIVSYTVKYKTASLSLAAQQVNIPLAMFALWIIWFNRRNTK